MILRAISDSDLTSLGQSSSTGSSPKRALYYVESPSRDSLDGDSKSSSSINADSPSHSSSSYGLHSYTSSSASRFSGPYRGVKGCINGREDKWPDCYVIDEEGDYDEFCNSRNGFSTGWQAFIAILGFVAVFATFCLVVLIASRPYTTRFTVKSMEIKKFSFGQGSDLTGVPTKFMTLNCSMEISVHNPAKFFGIHVTSTSIHLMYSQLTVATGQLERYYQPRNSYKATKVKVEGKEVPLYGAGANADFNADVPFKLLIAIRSQGDVVGKLVKSVHLRRASCHLMINSREENTTYIDFRDDSCVYD